MVIIKVHVSFMDFDFTAGCKIFILKLNLPIDQRKS